MAACHGLARGGSSVRRRVDQNKCMQLNPGATLACHLRLRPHFTSHLLTEPTHTAPILANGVSAFLPWLLEVSTRAMGKSKPVDHEFCSVVGANDRCPHILPMATLERLPRASRTSVRWERGHHTSTAAEYRDSQAVFADLLCVTRHHVLPRIPLEEKNNLSSRDIVCNTAKRPALRALSRDGRLRNGQAHGNSQLQRALDEVGDDEQGLLLWKI
jgi:hypothetical protein